jgi:hypothetical protein
VLAAAEIAATRMAARTILRGMSHDRGGAGGRRGGALAGMRRLAAARATHASTKAQESGTVTGRSARVHAMKATHAIKLLQLQCTARADQPYARANAASETRARSVP